MATNPTPTALKPLSQSVDELLNQGFAVMVGEYRGWKTDKLSYTSKKDGSKRELNMLLHSVEVGEGNALEGVKVTSYLPDDVDLKEVKSQFAKGERVAIVVSALAEVSGVRKISAKEGGIFKLPAKS